MCLNAGSFDELVYRILSSNCETSLQLTLTNQSQARLYVKFELSHNKMPNSADTQLADTVARLTWQCAPLLSMFQMYQTDKHRIILCKTTTSAGGESTLDLCYASPEEIPE